MSTTILVTGATGNVGKEVIKSLMAKGSQVRAAIRNIEKLRTMGPEGIEPVSFEFDDPKTFDIAMAGVDKIFMIAPPLAPNSYELLTPLIKKAVDMDVRRIVFLSAMGVDMDDSYPLGKIEIEIEKSGLEYTFLRPNWFMQNFNSSLLGMIKEKGGIFLPAEDSKTSFIDARDIAEVAVAALLTDNHIGKGYTLTGSRSLDHHEAVKILSEAIGKTVIYQSITDEAMQEALKEMGTPQGNIQLMSILYGMVRDGYTAPVTDDVKKILGRNPISLEQYARDYADMFK